MAKETGLKVTVAENPLECVVRGSGKIIDNISLYEKIIMPPSK
ncbi:MAG: rod shape-determining protein [bacterium]|nr:rod shape-determining protein [bacterium]